MGGPEGVYNYNTSKSSKPPLKACNPARISGRFRTDGRPPDEGPSRPLRRWSDGTPEPPSPAAARCRARPMSRPEAFLKVLSTSTTTRPEKGVDEWPVVRSKGCLFGRVRFCWGIGRRLAIERLQQRFQAGKPPGIYFNVPQTHNNPTD